MNKNQIIILGGNVKSNISWIQKINKYFNNDYDITDIYYDHWNNNQSIDFDVELKKLEKIDKELDDYYIIAKSVGSVLALMGIEKQIIKPQGIIILGLPLKYIVNNNINIDKLVNYAINKTNIMVIQQKNDPIGKYSEVVKILPSIIEVIEIPGNYHVYGNIDLLKPFIANFI